MNNNDEKIKILMQRYEKVIKEIIPLMTEFNSIREELNNLIKEEKENE